MSASVPKTKMEQTSMVEDAKPLSPVPLLHTTFRWPEGGHLDGMTCPHCGKPFRVGQRAGIVDARFYQKNVSEGDIDESQIYAHALCIQKEASHGRGWFPLTTLA